VDSSSGNVYVTDTANNRIQVFSSNGTFITTWGKFGLVDGNFAYPRGTAVDSSSGNVYVTDTANNRIQVFSKAIS
jgi:DNA-binding beta-propeller fold protein YncE